MGLASKLAAAQANQGAAPPGTSGYGAPPPQQPPGSLPYPGQQPGGPPPASSPAPPGVSGYGAPPPGSPAPGPGASGYGAPPGPPPGRPQSGQYSAPPGPPPGSRPQSQYGQPPPGQYAPPPGQPPMAGGGFAPPAYGAPPGQPPMAAGGNASAQPPPGGRISAQSILQVLQKCVVEQKIQAFYPPQALHGIAEHIANSGHLERVAQEWRLPMEIAIDLVRIALFDVVLFVDDSGSMAFEEGGSRIDDLKLILSRVAQITSMFDADGISVRLMNSREGGDNIRNEADVQGLVSRIRFTGLTPFGSQLNQKVIEPLILGPARQGRLQKPVSIIAITDGCPAGEDRYTLFKTVITANRELSRTRYGPDALSLQIAQVGNDIKARQFLEEIDNHPEVGGLVDCTSNYELEADEMMKANPPVDLTPELWLVKMLLGGIDDSYDAQDES